MRTKDIEAGREVQQLLDELDDLDEISITRNGIPVARLVSFPKRREDRIQRSFEDIAAYRKERTSPGLSVEDILAMREEGRK